MSNPVLVSQSDVSLPLLLPFLMATLSCQWVTPHLWLPDVCFSSPGIIHITQVHWYLKKTTKKQSLTTLCISKVLYNSWRTLHATFFLSLFLIVSSAWGWKQANTRSPSWIGQFSMEKCFPVVETDGEWAGAWRFMNNPCVLQCIILTVPA